MKIKTIRLTPSKFKCDIFIGIPDKKFVKFCCDRYGLTKEDAPRGNECILYYTGTKSKLKGRKRFVIILESLKSKKDHIIVHEIVHLLWQYSGETNVSLSKDSQEWQAIMLEDIFTKIRNKKGYRNI